MSILIVSLDSFAICNLCPSLSQETCFVLHFYDVIIRCRKYTAIRECSNTVYVYRNVKRICAPTVEKYRSRILWKAIKHHQKTLKLKTISKYAWEDLEYIVLLQSRGWLHLSGFVFFCLYSLFLCKKGVSGVPRSSRHCCFHPE